MNRVLEDVLMHYGVSKYDGAPGPGSGRYPAGSGENPNQHRGDFLSRVEKLQKDGLSEKEIADYLEISTGQLRARKAIAKQERRNEQRAIAERLKDEGWSLNAIAKELGFSNDSSVRNLLKDGDEAKRSQAMVTADYLKKLVDEKGMLDVGAGVETELGISREKLNQALLILEEEGYPTYGRGVQQVTNPGKQTNIKVLCPPGTEHREVFDDTKINSVKDYDYILTEDGTRVRQAFTYPSSLDSKRLMINYADAPNGGDLKDGVIEIRRGVKDLDLGEGTHYAQVRIMVDGTHYLKGMAVYADDLPDGIDVRFNTNKKDGTPALGPKDNTVLKPIKNDPTNPFGSAIKEVGGQSWYIDKDGKEKLSLINKRADEGDWEDWDKTLPSQFLAKQSKKLAERQLNMAAADKKAEFDEICSLTNPTVKRKLLESFAEDCDSAAVHLKAAALPRQRYQVILPLTSIKDNEVYAPNFKDGEKIALVRFPHEGTYQIPILTVNNKIAEGKRVIGIDSKDSVGINKRNANILSGADFDGDTVLCIPTGSKVKITNKELTGPLKELADFDAKLTYGGKPEGTFKRMTKQNTQREMGIISNLIMDMTLRGATDEELARATKHSQTVIDAEKHGLDYKQSEKDNRIAELKRKYQKHYDTEGVLRESGASTLITRAKGEQSVVKRQGQPIINPDGSLTYKESTKAYYEETKKVKAKDPVTGKLLKDENGKQIYEKDPITGKDLRVSTGKIKAKMEKSTQMAETKDARTLSSGLPMEELYADYANTMKSLANEARKEMKFNTGRLQRSASAALTYDKEVGELMSQLNVAKKNAPRERKAQLIANTKVAAAKQDNPDMSKEDIKKLSQRALVDARVKVGAARHPISINDKQWEAIQAGAISDSVLTEILRYADTDDLRQRATPRASSTLSQAKQNLISSMKASGYSNADIADRIGVSVSTVIKYS